MYKTKLMVIVECLLCFVTISHAQNITNYLILQDIDSYKLITEVKNPATKEITQISSYTITSNSGVLMSVDHFFLDHSDTDYKVYYESNVADIGVTVQITQHAGSESDKWLMHEIEDSLRDGETETLGLLTSGVRLREINGKMIISLRGNVYRWVRNNVVVNISYTDLQGVKPEPLEVIQAYLAKYPSTITMTSTEFKGNVHTAQWIKDEMERRLWLCDKWLMQLQLGKVSQKDTLEELVNHMTVFLNYRQKYYSIKATDEIAALNTALRANDGTTIKNKLTAYKTWWTANKGKSVSILWKLVSPWRIGGMK